MIARHFARYSRRRVKLRNAHFITHYDNPKIVRSPKLHFKRQRPQISERWQRILTVRLCTPNLCQSIEMRVKLFMTVLFNK